MHNGRSVMQREGRVVPNRGVVIREESGSGVWTILLPRHHNSSVSAMDPLALLEAVDLRQVLLFLLFFLLIADFLKNRKPPNYPPGPPALPFLGNVLNIDAKQPHVYLSKLSEVYGNVFGLRLGRDRVVFVTGYKLVKEALVTQADVFAERPDNPLGNRLYPGNSGLFFSNGQSWKKQRRFALSTLRNLGLGKRTLELAICEESRCLLEELERQKGDAFNPARLLNNAVGNIICQLVFGRRFCYSDVTFQMILQNISETVHLQGSLWAQLYEAFPIIMKHLPGRHNNIFRNYETFTSFIRGEVEEHKKNLNPDSPRDYIDAFLIEMKHSSHEPVDGFHEFNLVLNSLDLFLAGTETTSTTLLWALLFLVKYPDVQEKVQAEIDSVIGQSRQPMMSDRPDMPYTDAVLHEVQRMGNIVPLNGLRVADRDTTLGGHFIPKGTTLLTILSSVLFDKSEWDSPERFNPGHFLDAEGRFRRPDAFIPFSAGKRVCLGEQLAKMELFLFFVSLFQKFRFSTSEGTELSMEGKVGVTRIPYPFKICAQPR
ncbi:cytochrome P450 2J2-like isoform X2 [Denticeps clupeoides]|uniref:cytochrome P450 2J2-like isoform X2 n=1 Tax=Denticeps clupeoides TaxID=299321 RepID=UPI0010A322EE|nr:cytochrome P450 2J2-like isoform X2 [Denticeps clupeoides]